MSFFNSLASLANNVAKTAVAPVAVTANLADMIAKPVADMANELVKGTEELKK